MALIDLIRGRLSDYLRENSAIDDAIAHQGALTDSILSLGSNVFTAPRAAVAQTVETFLSKYQYGGTQRLQAYADELAGDLYMIGKPGATPATPPTYTISLTGAVEADPVRHEGADAVVLEAKSLDANALTRGEVPQERLPGTTAEKLPEIPASNLPNIPASKLPAATASAIGGVKRMPAMTDVLVAPTALNWNALMAALRNAGLMAP